MFKRKRYSLLLSTMLFATCSVTGTAADPVGPWQERVAQDAKIEKLLRAEMKKLHEIQARIDRLEKQQRKRTQHVIEYERQRLRADLQKALNPQGKKNKGMQRQSVKFEDFFRQNRLRNDQFTKLENLKRLKSLKNWKDLEKLGANDVQKLKNRLLEAHKLQAEQEKLKDQTKNKILEALKDNKLGTLGRLFHQSADKTALKNLHGLHEMLQGAHKNYEQAQKAYGKAFKNLEQLDPLVRKHVEQALKAAGVMIGNHFRGKAISEKLHKDLYAHINEIVRENVLKSVKEHHDPRASTKKHRNPGKSGAHSHEDLQREVNALRHEVHEVRRMLEQLKAHLHKKGKSLH